MSGAKHGCCADKACNEKTCMELATGKTCGDCLSFRHCEAFYAHKPTDTYCDFFPRRFRESAAALEAAKQFSAALPDLPTSTQEGV